MKGDGPTVRPGSAGTVNGQATLPILYLCLAFVPLALTPKIIVTLTVLVPVGGFGLIGISDDSLTRWLGSWWRWRKGRRLITYRGECKKK